MSAGGLPTEVELVYEVAPCAALRRAQSPGTKPHPCAYFAKWGRYHSYAYEADGPPPTPGIVQPSVYLGKGPMAPEALSGCRKAPIMAVGINPNQPGWWPAGANSISPLFDDYRQYAHYFRYRETAKLRIPLADYQAFGGGPADTPLSNTELTPPANASGLRIIPVELQPVTMYQAYQAMLTDLAAAMGWDDHKLTVGEDVAYGNMVACPSAKWINAPDPNDPAMPPMTDDEQRGIVAECFHHRGYFRRQLIQSLPAVLMIFSQSTADAFLGEMAANFSKGAPKLGDKIDDLLNREIRLGFGAADDHQPLDARVIFAPHITGDPARFGAARAKVLGQLIDEAKSGRLALNAATGHLRRPRGACVFCTMIQIGPCDYQAELRPLIGGPALTADSGAPALMAEKAAGQRLLRRFITIAQPPARAADPVEPASLAATPRHPRAFAQAALDMSAHQAALRSQAGWNLAGDPKRQPP